MFLKLSGIQKCLWLCFNVGEKEAFLDYIEKLDLKCDHIIFFYNF